MRTIVSLFVTFGVGATAVAAEVVVPTSPDAVTVFRGNALVQRTGRTSLAGGLHKLRLPGFPARMRDSSVRIRLGGKAHLVGFSVEKTPVEDVVSPAARKLEQELEGLLDKERTLSDARKVLVQRTSFISSLRSTYRQWVTLNMALATLDPQQWASVHGFARQRLVSISTERQRLAKESRELSRKVNLVRRKLKQLRSKRAKQTKSIAVDVRARSAGPVRVVVRYLVPRSRWRSVYDAILEGSKIRFVHYGIVTQESGEDWDGVRLTLSSASASQAVNVPKLSSQYLRFGYPRRDYWRRRYRRRRYRRYSRPKKRGARSLDGFAEPSRLRLQDAEGAARARTAQFAAAYDLRGRVTIPSTGRPRKVTVAALNVPARLEYVAVPRLRAGAFLTARATYQGEVPLIPGEVSLFLGRDYLGDTRIGFLSSGGELRLSYGRDDRLRIRRKRLKRKVHTQGVFTKEYRIDYVYRIDVENLVGRRVRLSLLDQVPVSMNEKIKVEIHESTSPRARLKATDAKGTLRFELDLRPKQKQSVTIAYSVTYPRKLRVSGLE